MSKEDYNNPPLDSPLHGIGLMIIMTASFTLLDASAKYICNELPLGMVMWGRYFFHFIFFALVFLWRAPRDIIFTKNIKLQILRSVLIFITGLTFWSGLIFLPLADCTVIAYSWPLLVTILAVFLLDERFGYHRWGSVTIGLLGVIFVIRPGMGVAHLGVVLPLLTALFHATVLVTTRILGQRENALTTLFYTSIGGLILSGIIVLFSWKSPTPTQWLYLMWLGLLGALGQFLMIKAFEKAPASLLAPFGYTSLIWATLLGFFMFGDLPDVWTIFGAVIIISSGLYIGKRESTVAVL